MTLNLKRKYRDAARREYVQWLNVRCTALETALREATKAIKSLPEDALGMARHQDRYEWPIRDELLSKLHTTLDRYGKQ